MRWRLGLWFGLILGWLIMLLYLWAGFATLPSAERLEHSRMMAIPTLRTVVLLGVRSMVELGVLLLVLWPGWARFWAARLLTSSLLLAGWFLVTTPLTLSTMDWVHRRWIAANAAVLLLAFIVVVTAAVARIFASGGAIRAGAAHDPPVDA
jgi:hypothetical protein